MGDFEKMDRAEQALLADHSLAALEYLLACGREMEFAVGAQSCFLSRYETAGAVSLWLGQEEQSFASFRELTEGARIGGEPFPAAWARAELKTIF